MTHLFLQLLIISCYSSVITPNLLTRAVRPATVGSRHLLTDCSVGLMAHLKHFCISITLFVLWFSAYLLLSLNSVVKFGADLWLSS